MLKKVKTPIKNNKLNKIDLDNMLTFPNITTSIDKRLKNDFKNNNYPKSFLFVSIENRNN